MGMLERVVPAVVRAVEARDDPPEARLLAEEEHLVAAVVESRRREMTTVRHCARLALRSAGGPAAPILRGPANAPLWPAGFVGSMTHCAGYRAAAVAPAAEIRTIGIDAEPNDPLPAGVLRLIATPEEADWVDRHSRAAPHVPWDRLLFSAKESVYKAWYPVARRWLDFTDARIMPVGPGRLEVTLLLPGPVGFPSRFECRWTMGEGLLVTAVAVRAVVQ